MISLLRKGLRTISLLREERRRKNSKGDLHG
jgi:hypothetical protein